MVTLDLRRPRDKREEEVLGHKSPEQPTAEP
jgi:hypothetical protein